MRVLLLDSAKEHLIEGYDFYEAQQTGLGTYFLDSLFSDIDSLAFYGGAHRIVYGFHRSLSKQFPFAIYYLMQRAKFEYMPFSTVVGTQSPSAGNFERPEGQINGRNVVLRERVPQSAYNGANLSSNSSSCL